MHQQRLLTGCAQRKHHHQRIVESEQTLALGIQGSLTIGFLRHQTSLPPAIQQEIETRTLVNAPRHYLGTIIVLMNLTHKLARLRTLRQHLQAEHRRGVARCYPKRLILTQFLSQGITLRKP